MTAPTRPPVRWWPAVVILAIVAGLLLYFWTRPSVQSVQHRVIPTFPTLFFGALALFVWLVLFSRLPRRACGAIFVGTALVVATGFALFEIEGVDGNLVPILGLRWSSARRFAPVPGAAAGVTAPGPFDYPQFYGPRRDATLAGPRLDPDWRARPPREIWRRAVGEGWSSFAVVGDAALTQELRGEDEVVVRYDLETGIPIWLHADRAPFNTTVAGSGPRATPTIADGRVYTLGATGILNALDLATGERLWSRDVLADHGARQPDWGMASSPLVVGELVVVQLGRNGDSLAAYDRAGGAPVWQAGTDRGSYTSPTLLTVAGREQIVVVNQSSVAGHDPTTGELLWRSEWSDPGERITPPLPLGDDRLLVSAGYGVGSRLLEIVAGGSDGGYAVHELWRSRRLKSKFAPMVVRDGVLYGLDDGVLVALDPATGERRWKAGRYGHGQMILVGEHLLIQAENGDVVLVAADPDEHRELARLEALDSKTWNPPALAGSRLLVRNNREAACYELPLAGPRGARGR